MQFDAQLHLQMHTDQLWKSHIYFPWPYVVINMTKMCTTLSPKCDSILIMNDNYLDYKMLYPYLKKLNMLCKT